MRVYNKHIAQNLPNPPNHAVYLNKISDQLNYGLQRTFADIAYQLRTCSIS